MIHDELRKSIAFEIDSTWPGLTGRDVYGCADRILSHFPDPTATDDEMREGFTGRDIHRAWRDGMLVQGRYVAPERMAWETLSEQDKQLDGWIAGSLLRPSPASEQLRETLLAAKQAITYWEQSKAAREAENAVHAYSLGARNMIDEQLTALSRTSPARKESEKKLRCTGHLTCDKECSHKNIHEESGNCGSPENWCSGLTGKLHENCRPIVDESEEVTDGRI